MPILPQFLLDLQPAVFFQVASLLEGVVHDVFGGGGYDGFVSRIINTVIIFINLSISQYRVCQRIWNTTLKFINCDFLMIEGMIKVHDFLFYVIFQILSDQSEVIFDFVIFVVELNGDSLWLFGHIASNTTFSHMLLHLIISLTC